MIIFWSHPPGSNRRPADYESAALPTELGWLGWAFPFIASDARCAPPTERGVTLRDTITCYENLAEQASSPPRPMFFVPLAQSAKYSEDLLNKIDSRSHFIGAALIRSHVQAGSLEPVLRNAFAEAGPNLTVVSVHTMKEQIALVLDQQRAVAILAGLFGVVTLILAAVGLYGVTA